MRRCTLHFFMTISVIFFCYSAPLVQAWVYIAWFALILIWFGYFYMRYVHLVFIEIVIILFIFGSFCWLWRPSNWRQPKSHHIHLILLTYLALEMTYAHTLGWIKVKQTKKYCVCGKWMNEMKTFAWMTLKIGCRHSIIKKTSSERNH